ncbi:MAG: hypothetical protein AB1758_32825, partial [Candidatus Eremiobacterota bacterium]
MTGMGQERDPVSLLSRFSPALAWAGLTLLFYSPFFFFGKAFLPADFLYRTPPWYDPTVPLWNFDLFDAIVAYYPYQALLHEAMARGEFPAWNPFNLGGIPLLCNGQSGFLYPPRLVLTSLFPAVIAHGLSLALHTFAGGVLTYTLARRWGQSPAGAALTSLAWSFNPFVMAWLEMDFSNLAAALIPLVLLGVEQARTRWRGAAVTAVGVALLCTSGHLQWVLYSLVAVCLAGMWRLRGDPP